MKRIDKNYTYSWIGKSTEAKPTTADDGDTLYCVDTKAVWIF